MLSTQFVDSTFFFSVNPVFVPLWVWVRVTPFAAPWSSWVEQTCPAAFPCLVGQVLPVVAVGRADMPAAFPRLVGQVLL